MATRSYVIDGAKVRGLRERRGLNQPELAACCGITQSYLSRIEAGQRNASPGLIQTIAAQLGVTFDDITEETTEVAS